MISSTVSVIVLPPSPCTGFGSLRIFVSTFQSRATWTETRVTPSGILMRTEFTGLPLQPWVMRISRSWT